MQLRDLRFRKAAFTFCVFALSTYGASQIAITPKTAQVVTEGGTIKFKANRDVEWSMYAGSQGTVDADGTYHAPAHIRINQSVGGCQVLPNNHVLNVRIDSLPLHPKSQQWMHTVTKAGMSLSAGRLHYMPSLPLNPVTSATPSQRMTFAYTPDNNGPFRVLPPSETETESGSYTLAFGGMDRHIVMVETDTCTFQEMYNLYPAGTNVSNNCPACTSQSGVRFGALQYALPKGATDAASLFLLPLSLHRDEVLSGAIRHALRFTLAGSFIRAAHIWPANAEAGYNQTDVPPFGARFRLRSDFQVSSSNPYVAALVTQLKQYGLVLADIGGQWDIDASDVQLYFDPEIRAAFQEVARLIPPSNFEIVDESGLMLNDKSGETPSDAEAVIAKDRKTGETGLARITLAGVAIGVDSTYLVMQSGAPAHKIRAWVNGSSDKAVGWSMNPSIGTLTADGAYTPPTQLQQKTEFNIMAVAHADQQVKTFIHVTLLPPGPIRINNGSRTPTKDSQGNIWMAECCIASAYTYDYGGGTWPSQPDINLYKDATVDWNDISYRFYVPPGNYRITAKFAEASYQAPNIRWFHLESQGHLIYRDVDLFAQAGFKSPIDFNLPAVVGPDGALNFSVRHVKGEQALLNALQIVPDSGTPRLQLWPVKSNISVAKRQQFYAIPWYANMTDKDVKWSISPNVGSIDQRGVYSAPISPVAENTAVSVIATSALDPRLTAKSVIVVNKGIPTIRVNCGGGEFTDAQQHLWSADFGYDGGVSYGGNLPIKGASDDMQKLYQNSRYNYGVSGFSYSFQLPNGNYRVTLKWAEYRKAADVPSPHMLYMSVSINGARVLHNFDPVAAAGGVLTAIDKTFSATVTKGVLRIDFMGDQGAGYIGPDINGIEIDPVQ